MKTLIAAACICTIAATVGSVAVGFHLYRKSDAESRQRTMAKCTELARMDIDPASLTEADRAELKSVAERCLAFMRGGG